MPAKETIRTEARRSRRSVIKAACVVMGALSAAAVGGRKASAQYNWGRECFLRGTRIQTTRGYRQVETLTAGDLLLARFGGVTPIVRIGRFAVPRGGDVRPVRVARSALDDNVPTADLWLTGPHSIHIDGVLVSISDLVNGSTIAYDDDAGTDRDKLEFFHIELAQHDVIDAEGAPCESLLTPSMIRCAPRVCLNGGRSELRSRLRSAVAIIVDRRTPFDLVRDKLEERSLSLQARSERQPHADARALHARRSAECRLPAGE